MIPFKTKNNCFATVLEIAPLRQPHFMLDRHKHARRMQECVFLVKTVQVTTGLSRHLFVPVRTSWFRPWISVYKSEFKWARSSFGSAWVIHFCAGSVRCQQRFYNLDGQTCIILSVFCWYTRILMSFGYSMLFDLVAAIPQPKISHTTC